MYYVFYHMISDTFLEYIMYTLNLTTFLRCLLFFQYFNAVLLVVLVLNRPRSRICPHKVVGHVPTKGLSNRPSISPTRYHAVRLSYSLFLQLCIISSRKLLLLITCSFVCRKWQTNQKQYMIAHVMNFQPSAPEMRHFSSSSQSLNKD